MTAPRTFAPCDPVRHTELGCTGTILEPADEGRAWVAWDDGHPSTDEALGDLDFVNTEQWEQA